MSEKHTPYRCKCGFNAKDKKQLKNHCNKDHKGDPYILYDLIGEIGSIELGNKLVARLIDENTKLKSEQIRIQKENEQSDKEVIKGNETIQKLTHALNIIAGSTNIPKEKHDDMITTIFNTLSLLNLSVKQETGE